MQPFQQIAAKLFPFRGTLFAFAVVGLLISLAAMLLVPSNLGFVLIGPLAGFPWCLACAARTHTTPLCVLFFAFALVTLCWPIIVIFG